MKGGKVYLLQFTTLSYCEREYSLEYLLYCPVVEDTEYTLEAPIWNTHDTEKLKSTVPARKIKRAKIGKEKQRSGELLINASAPKNISKGVIGVYEGLVPYRFVNSPVALRIWNGEIDQMGFVDKLLRGEYEKYVLSTKQVSTTEIQELISFRKVNPLIVNGITRLSSTRQLHFVDREMVLNSGTTDVYYTDQLKGDNFAIISSFLGDVKGFTDSEVRKKDIDATLQFLTQSVLDFSALLEKFAEGELKVSKRELDAVIQCFANSSLQVTGLIQGLGIGRVIELAGGTVFQNNLGKLEYLVTVPKSLIGGERKIIDYSSYLKSLSRGDLRGREYGAYNSPLSEFSLGCTSDKVESLTDTEIKFNSDLIRLIKTGDFRTSDIEIYGFDKSIRENKIIQGEVQKSLFREHDVFQDCVLQPLDKAQVSFDTNYQTYQKFRLISAGDAQEIDVIEAVAGLEANSVETKLAENNLLLDTADQPLQKADGSQLGSLIESEFASNDSLETAFQQEPISAETYNESSRDSLQTADNDYLEDSILETLTGGSNNSLEDVVFENFKVSGGDLRTEAVHQELLEAGVFFENTGIDFTPTEIGKFGDIFTLQYSRLELKSVNIPELDLGDLLHLEGNVNKSFDYAEINYEAGVDETEAGLLNKDAEENGFDYAEKNRQAVELANLSGGDFGRRDAVFTNKFNIINKGVKDGVIRNQLDRGVQGTTDSTNQDIDNAKVELYNNTPEKFRGAEVGFKSDLSKDTTAEVSFKADEVRPHHGDTVQRDALLDIKPDTFLGKRSDAVLDVEYHFINEKQVDGDENIIERGVTLSETLVTKTKLAETGKFAVQEHLTNADLDIPKEALNEFNFTQAEFSSVASLTQELEKAQSYSESDGVDLVGADKNDTEGVVTNFEQGDEGREGIIEGYDEADNSREALLEKYSEVGSGLRDSYPEQKLDMTKGVFYQGHPELEQDIASPLGVNAVTTSEYTQADDGQRESIQQKGYEFINEIQFQGTQEQELELVSVQFDSTEDVFDKAEVSLFAESSTPEIGELGDRDTLNTDFAVAEVGFFSKELEQELSSLVTRDAVFDTGHETATIDEKDAFMSRFKLVKVEGTGTLDTDFDQAERADREAVSEHSFNSGDKSWRDADALDSPEFAVEGLEGDLFGPDSAIVDFKSDTEAGFLSADLEYKSGPIEELKNSKVGELKDAIQDDFNYAEESLRQGTIDNREEGSVYYTSGPNMADIERGSQETAKDSEISEFTEGLNIYTGLSRDNCLINANHDIVNGSEILELTKHTVEITREGLPLDFSEAKENTLETSGKGHLDDGTNRRIFDSHTRDLSVCEFDLLDVVTQAADAANPHGIFDSSDVARLADNRIRALEGGESANLDEGAVLELEGLIENFTEAVLDFVGLNESLADEGTVQSDGVEAATENGRMFEYQAQSAEEFIKATEVSSYESGGLIEQGHAKANVSEVVAQKLLEPANALVSEGFDAVDQSMVLGNPEKLLDSIEDDFNIGNILSFKDSLQSSKFTDADIQRAFEAVNGNFEASSPKLFKDAIQPKADKGEIQDYTARSGVGYKPAKLYNFKDAVYNGFDGAEHDDLKESIDEGYVTGTPEVFKDGMADKLIVSNYGDLKDAVKEDFVGSRYGNLKDGIPKEFADAQLDNLKDGLPSDLANGELDNLKDSIGYLFDLGNHSDYEGDFGEWLDVAIPKALQDAVGTQYAKAQHLNYQANVSEGLDQAEPKRLQDGVTTNYDLGKHLDYEGVSGGDLDKGVHSDYQGLIGDDLDKGIHQNYQGLLGKDLDIGTHQEYTGMLGEGLDTGKHSDYSGVLGEELDEGKHLDYQGKFDGNFDLAKHLEYQGKLDGDFDLGKHLEYQGKLDGHFDEGAKGVRQAVSSEYDLAELGVYQAVQSDTVDLAELGVNEAVRADNFDLVEKGVRDAVPADRASKAELGEYKAVLHEIKQGKVDMVYNGKVDEFSTGKRFELIDGLRAAFASMAESAKTITAPIIQGFDKAIKKAKKVRVRKHTVNGVPTVDEPPVEESKKKIWLIMGKPSTWNIWPWKKTR